MRSDFITLKYIFFSKLYNFVLFFTMDSEQPASSGLKVMTRNELFNIMERSGASTFNEKILIMEQEVLNQYEGNDQNIAEIKQKLSIIRHQFKQRWSVAHNTKARFLERNKDWLQGSISLPKTGVSPGRPQKSFSDLSERSKRRKTEELRGAGTDELTYATQMKLRETGKVDASKIVKDLTKSPTRARKYAVAIKKKTSETNEESREDKHLRALFMYTEAGLTQTQYEIVRDSNPSFYPCYSILQKLKKECYPDIHRITETCAEVTVQSLMDHTAQRLLMHLGEADLNQQLNSAEKQSLVLISKWGYDGSQQMQFKMKFVNEADSDANIFQSSMVPLQLVYGPERKILWQNPKPSSPRYCRPIRIRFVKETTDITNEEIAIIKTQISELTKTRVNDFSIGHKLLFTMVDGKVCNAATHTKSTMRCYLCGATSAQFNNLDNMMPCKKENMEFGLSLLHARIRFFESMLHVAYKLPVKKWNVRLTAEETDLVQRKKKEIQDKFREQLGLLVDIPKANLGNTIDGNTSRRFFDNYEISANITGIDQNLIYRLKIILDTLCSGLQINVEAFKIYCDETAKLYVSLYKFYPMSPTLHKVLRHGAEVVAEAILPIGQLSEEAAEARNKHIRMFRLDHSRKFSRVECNADVLNRLLLTSDPFLAGLRKRKNKKKTAFSPDVLGLLLESNNFNISFDDDNDDEVIDE